MKFATEDVVGCLEKAQIEPDKKDAVLQELRRLQQELEAAKEERENSKKQFIILASGPVSETSMWIVQTEEGFDHNKLPEIITKATNAYKNGKRKNKAEIKNIGDAILNVPKKEFTAFEVGLKTKEPVIVVDVSTWKPTATQSE